MGLDVKFTCEVSQLTGPAPPVITSHLAGSLRVGAMPGIDKTLFSEFEFIKCSMLQQLGEVAGM